MRTLALSLVVAASLSVGVGNLRSQQAAAIPKNGPEAMAAAKVANQKLIERQTATLKQLEELEKNAQQLRIFAARN
ncbi:MAG: hypothetical protein ACO1QR_04610 [Chthoniobacteraceae bacterium]